MTPNPLGDYNLPPHVGHIWAMGDKLRFVMPPLAGMAKAHHIDIPATPVGMVLLLELLRQRARDGQQGIGHKGEPVQYDIEEMLRYMGRDVTKIPPRFKRDVPAGLTLEDLDI